jgi:hypothetical protein
LNSAIIASIIVAAALLLSRRVSRSHVWRATVTPLASIIGSGFLVLAPILVSAYGRNAPLIMAGLCLGAYLFGSAIRFSIAERNSPNHLEDALVEKMEIAASWALTFAFMISVAYYLNLFGAFGVSLTPYDNHPNAKLLTSAIFLIILVVGWTRGFKALEKMEYAAVSVKLAVIVGLLVGLASYFSGKAIDHSLFFDPPHLTGWAGVTLAFGLVITVQGFETSRYLGIEYDAATRIKSMQLAQLLASAIYMIYIFLFAFSFDRSQFLFSETAIIDMMGIVTPILPWLLVAAALSAQFSAAIADTSGSGGLTAELTKGRVKPHLAYALLVSIGLLLTWSANVFQIISYASRAFALYYSLQAVIAARRAYLLPDQQWKAAAFAVLALLGSMIVLFGNSVEG